MKPTFTHNDESPILTSMNRTQFWFQNMLFQNGIIPKESATEEILNTIECDGSVFDGCASHTRHFVETEDGVLCVEAIAHGLMEWSYYIHKAGVIVTPESCPNLWAKLYPSQEVIDYIDECAKRTEAWVAEDPQTRWAAYAVSEPWYLATLVEEGIQTLDQYIHNTLVNNVFEYWRSVRGYKPDYSMLKAMSIEELRVVDAEIAGEYRLQKEWEKQQEEQDKQKRDIAWVEARELANRLGQSIKTLIKWGVLDRRELYPA
jgi:hypothetical protein